MLVFRETLRVATVFSQTTAVKAGLGWRQKVFITNLLENLENQRPHLSTTLQYPLFTLLTYIYLWAKYV